MRVTLIAVGVVVLLCLASMAYLFWALRDEVIDHRNDWPSYYSQEIEPFLSIPREATILKAEERIGFVREQHRIQFTLPSDKSPDEWIKSIKERSKAFTEVSLEESHLEARLGDGFVRIDYISDSKIYDVFWEND